VPFLPKILPHFGATRRQRQPDGCSAVENQTPYSSRPGSVSCPRLNQGLNQCIALADGVHQQQEAEAAHADSVLLKAFPTARLIVAIEGLLYRGETGGMVTDHRIFYRRHLPHWQPDGATLFITFRLAGSLPRAVIAALQEKREQDGCALSHIRG
jgi:hypothetical protein